MQLPRTNSDNSDMTISNAEGAIIATRSPIDTTGSLNETGIKVNVATDLTNANQDQGIPSDNDTPTNEQRTPNSDLGVENESTLVRTTSSKTPTIPLQKFDTEPIKKVHFDNRVIFHEYSEPQIPPKRKISFWKKFKLSLRFVSKI